MAEALPDLALYESTLSSMSKSAESVANLLSESAEDLPSYSNGISLLSLKNSILLSYMHNMALLALCKLEGRSLEKDDQVRKTLVERLIKERVILEKIKPLEARLKYQVDKLVKKAEDADRVEAEGGNPEDDEEIGNGRSRLSLTERTVSRLTGSLFLKQILWPSNLILLDSVRLMAVMMKTLCPKLARVGSIDLLDWCPYHSPKTREVRQHVSIYIVFAFA